MPITYKFPKPPNLNKQLNTARTNKFAAASSKKAWTNKCMKACEAQGIIEFLQPVFIMPTVTYSTATSDVDNMVTCLKPILDGMVKAGVLEDDNVKFVLPRMYCRFIKTKRNDQYVQIDIFVSKEEYLDSITKDLTTYEGI